MPDQEESPTKSLTHSDAQIEEAKGNLEAALEAYDKNGEAGLQAEMERIHPPAFKRIHLPNFPGSSAHLSPTPLDLGQNEK